MAQRYVVKAACWLEIIVGAIFLVVPDIPCILLFDAKPESMSRPLARWVGVSRIALGVACLPRKRMEPHRRAGLGFSSLTRGWPSCLPTSERLRQYTCFFHGLLLFCTPSLQPCCPPVATRATTEH